MASNGFKPPHPKSEVETINFTFDVVAHDDENHHDEVSIFDEIDAK